MLFQADILFGDLTLFEYTIATLKNLLSHTQFLNQPVLRSQVCKLCMCVTYVIGSARIDHVSTNYTELYFLLISSVQNVVSHFRKLQKKAH